MPSDHIKPVYEVVAGKKDFPIFFSFAQQAIIECLVDDTKSHPPTYQGRSHISKSEGGLLTRAQNQKWGPPRPLR